MACITSLKPLHFRVFATRKMFLYVRRKAIRLKARAYTLSPFASVKMVRPFLSVAALGLLLAAPALAQPDLSVSLTGPSPVEGTAGSSHSVGFVVSNGGTSAATTFRVRVRVPVGVRLDAVASSPGVTVTATTRVLTFEVTNALASASTWSVPLNLRITNEAASGVLEAEILAQSPADLDSTPGDGTGDDYASASVVGTPIPALPAGYQVQAVAFGRLGTPYAAVYQRGVYRFVGGSWQPINAGLTNLNVWDVDAVNSVGGADALVAATIGGGLFRFDPTTETWTATPSGLRNARGVVTFDGNTLYATGDLATGQSAVYRSDNDGRTWTALGIVGEGAMEPWSISVVPTAVGGPTVYVGTRRGLYKSTDGGMSFAATGFIGNRADAFDVVAINDLVIVGTRDGIHRSTDGGATFGPLLKTTPGTDRSRNVYDLEYRPAQGAIPARLYVSHWGRPGVVVSTDFGLSFTDIPLIAPPDRFVDRMAIGPDGTFFLAMEEGGLAVTGPADATAADNAAALDGFDLRVSGANPFTSRTTLRLTLGTSATVRVDVFDVLGRSVQTLASGDMAAGSHTLAVDLGASAPGVYLVRATAGAASRALPLVVSR